MKKRKIPYNLIIFDIVLIVAASAVTTAALLLSKHSILIVAVPMFAYSILSLFNIYQDIIRRISFIFNAVKNDDYSFRFADTPAVTDFALVNYSLNRIKEVLDSAKLQIREKEKYFELIMECANIGIITVMKNGAVVQANSKATNLFGLIRLSHVNQLRPISETLADALMRIRNGEQTLVRYVNETGEMSLSLNCSDLKLGERDLRVITIGDVNNELNDKEIESWDKLTRILTHEIMNSLAPITSISHTLLTAAPDSEEMHSGLQTIHDTSKRLLSFVDSFRQVTRLPTPQKAPFYLLELVNEAASLNDLIPNANDYVNQTNVKVNCIMAISGQLTSPDIKLDLDLPNEREEVQALVRNYIPDEEQVNMQMLYLLGIGKFYTPENTGTTQNSNMMTSVLSSTLSGQLNNALANIINNNNWNIGTNFSTGEKGWTDVEFEGMLSGQLLNNRLLINGNFGYRDNPLANTNFVGDFEAEWLVVRSGNIRLKAYNETNDRYYTRTNLTTQGIGIIFKKDFDKWTDLLFWKRWKRKRTAPADTIPQQTAPADTITQHTAP